MFLMSNTIDEFCSILECWFGNWSLYVVNNDFEIWSLDVEKNGFQHFVLILVLNRTLMSKWFGLLVFEVCIYCCFLCQLMTRNDEFMAKSFEIGRSFWNRIWLWLLVVSRWSTRLKLWCRFWFTGVLRPKIFVVDVDFNQWS